MDWRVNCSFVLRSQPDLKIKVCLVVEGGDYGGASCLRASWTRNSRRNFNMYKTQSAIKHNRHTEEDLIIPHGGNIII
jgi:hypothetical protein